MATPHVAGAWAVLKQKAPSASVSQILSALTNTGKPITDNRNGITKTRIQIDAALNALSGVTPTPTPAPTPTPTPGGTIPLTSGVPQAGSLSAPPQPGTVTVTLTQFTINVPAGATELKIDLNGNADVDLYARFGTKVEISGSTPPGQQFVKHHATRVNIAGC